METQSKHKNLYFDRISKLLLSLYPIHFTTKQLINHNGIQIFVKPTNQAILERQYQYHIVFVNTTALSRSTNMNIKCCPLRPPSQIVASFSSLQETVPPLFPIVLPGFLMIGTRQTAKIPHHSTNKHNLPILICSFRQISSYHCVEILFAISLVSLFKQY